MAKEIDIPVVLEKGGYSVATYSDVSGLAFDKLFVKRDLFNGKYPPKKITVTLQWEE